MHVVVVMNMVGMESPFIVKILSRLLQPLQGLFNILVFTRPHIKVCRQLNPQFTWFQAFCYVIKSGGDDDRNPNERRRRRGSSMRSSSLRSSAGDTGSRRGSMFGPLKRQSTAGHMEAKLMERNASAVIDTMRARSDSNRDLSLIIEDTTQSNRKSLRLSQMTVDSQLSGTLVSPETDIENSFEAKEESRQGQGSNRNPANSSNHSKRRSVTFACDDAIASNHSQSSIPCAGEGSDGDGDNCKEVDTLKSRSCENK